MVEAYNYYAGGFIPKVNPKTNVHNRRELKSKYKSIVALNNANPLAMISLSKDTSDYALDVKSMSMELGEAASLALDSDQQGEALETTLQLYNKLLSRSDEYGNLKNKPSRPGCELRKLVEETGAKSTDLQSPESADHLCGKCDKYAACWKEKADQLWDERQKEKAAKAGC